MEYITILNVLYGACVHDLTQAYVSHVSEVLTKFGHSLYSPYELAARSILPNTELPLSFIPVCEGMTSSYSGSLVPRHFCVSLLKIHKNKDTERMEYTRMVYIYVYINVRMITCIHEINISCQKSKAPLPQHKTTVCTHKH